MHVNSPSRTELLGTGITPGSGPSYDSGSKLVGHNSTYPTVYDAIQEFANANLPAATVSSMAALRLVSGAEDGQTITLSGYSSENDGGGGIFVWNSTSTASDNGGTIIAPTGVSTGRWYRIFNRNNFYIEWFGPHADGTTDDLSILNGALSAVVASGGGILWLGAKSYAISGVWSNNNSNVIIKGAGCGNGSTNQAIENYATSLVALSTCTGSMLYIGPVNSSGSYRTGNCGVEGIYFNGNGYATVGLDVISHTGGHFKNLTGANFIGASNAGVVRVWVTSAAISEGNDSQLNIFENIYVEQGESTISYNADAYYLGGPRFLGSGNASENIFISCGGVFKNNNLFTLDGADNNILYKCGGFQNSGGTGYGFDFKGAASGGTSANNNQVLFAGASSIARGTTSGYVVPSLNNAVLYIDKGNNIANPVIETGASMIWSDSKGNIHNYIVYGNVLMSVFEQELTTTSATDVINLIAPYTGLYTYNLYLRVTATTTISATARATSVNGISTYNYFTAIANTSTTTTLLNSASLISGEYVCTPITVYMLGGDSLVLEITAGTANQAYVSASVCPAS